MVLDKTLILKGVAGLAAVGGVAGGGVSIAYKKGAFKSQEEKDKESKQKKLKEVNDKLTTLGLTDCLLVESEVTSPTIFSKECTLDQSKFKKIKFSNRGDNQNEVTVAGWTSGNSIKLIISNKSDTEIKFLFKEAKDNLTITGENSQDKITLKKGQNNKETEFKEENGKLSKVVDETLKAKLKGYNTKLGTLVIPDGCRFDDTEKETSLECEVTQEDLKKIKFSNKADDSDLTLSGLSTGEKIKLKIEEKADQNSTILNYKFENKNSSELTITGTGANPKKIVLKSNKEREFKEESEKLVKQPANPTLSETLKGFNQKLETLKVPDDCRFDDTEEDTSIECSISSEEILKKIEFSNKGSGELTVKNWPSSPGNIKLKVEKETSSNEMSLSFQNVSSEITIHGDKSKGKIVLKNSSPAKKFKVEDNKLTKDASANTNKTRFQGFNKTLGDLNVPVECRFDEAESDSKVTCSVSKEQLKKIKFWNKQNESDLTIDNESNFTTANLEVVGDGTNMKIYFKNVTKTIKLTGVNNSFNLRQNTNGNSSNGDEYEVRSGVLGLVRNAESKGNSLGLTCTYTGNGNSGKCKASSNSLKVHAGETGGDVTVATDKEIFDFSEYEDGYNQLIKFTYTGEDTTPSNGNSSIKLEKNCHYEGQNKNQTWYLVKKTTGK